MARVLIVIEEWYGGNTPVPLCINGIARAVKIGVEEALEFAEHEALMAMGVAHRFIGRVEDEVEGLVLRHELPPATTEAPLASEEQVSTPAPTTELPPPSTEPPTTEAPTTEPPTTTPAPTPSEAPSTSQASDDAASA